MARIAFFLPHFPAGGQEQVTLSLMQGLAARGHCVELWLERREGAYLSRVPETIPIRELRRRSRWSGYRRLLPGWPREGLAHLRGALGLGPRSIPLHRLIGLVEALETNRPDVLVSAHDRAPLLALWAAGIAHHRPATMIVEHSLFSYNLAAARDDPRTYAIMQHRRTLMRRLYPHADALIAVSDGGAMDLADSLGLAHSAVTTLHNPVITPDLNARAAETIDDPWLENDAPPVVLSAARLAPEKALHVPIDALARLHANGSNARLVILGEGPEHERLTQRIADHGLEAHIRLPGWSDNPYAWMRRSALFVLSSEFEGLPTTLIEAMACGCPVIATDCPGGTRTILEDGRWGALVPVGDDAALARAIADVLASPPAPESLRGRASDFSLGKAVAAYEATIERICGGRC